MDTFEKDEMPMLSSSYRQPDENIGSQHRRFTSMTRSASLSIPMSDMEFFENENSLVGYTGPLRSEKRTSFMTMSDPLYVGRKPDNNFRPTPAAVRHKLTVRTTEKYSSVSGAERNDCSVVTTQEKMNIF